MQTEKHSDWTDCEKLDARFGAIVVSILASPQTALERSYNLESTGCRIGCQTNTSYHEIAIIVHAEIIGSSSRTWSTSRTRRL
jgi:hypothetical protein